MSEKRTNVVGSRLDDAELEQLDAVAARFDRDRAWVLRLALRTLVNGLAEIDEAVRVYENLHGPEPDSRSTTEDGGPT